MKKILFIMFLIINALAMMTLPGCRKDIDITGTWFITTTLLGETSTNTYTFDGNKDWGVVLWEGQALGTYSVSGENISFTLEYLDTDGNYTIEAYNGLFDGKDFMSGSFTLTVETSASTSGTWFGKR